MPVSLLPSDAHDQRLLSNVHPPQWDPPRPAERYHLVVLGGGTAGLVTAAGAAGLGAKVALIERELLGGDCLNVGCVPSKALLSAARAAATIRRGAEFGIPVPNGIEVCFAEVMHRLRRLRADLAPHDSAERFRKLGVDVFFGEARFLDRESVLVGDTRLRFRKAVIATGARAAHPDLPGLREAGFFTNESVFALTELPARWAVIGGGPIGCELSQALARLGAAVTMLEQSPRLLAREEPPAADCVRQALERDGVTIWHQARLLRVETNGAAKRLHVVRDGRECSLEVDALLVAAGRVPNVEGLNLEAAGVDYDVEHGVRVNDRLQTSNRHIFAAGDVCSPHKFTHAADFQARIVIQNALFHGRANARRLLIPRCTYTSPEVAQVGLTQAEAAERRVPVDVYRLDLADIDRAVLAGDSQGFVQVLTRRNSDRIVGATLVAEHAGEMLGELTLAMRSGIGLKALGATIHPYPTVAEAIRKLGDQYQRRRLTPWVRSLLGWWFAWTR
uniref:Mercuric reductase n=1 Tax=Schlesneria paludicola TaxID=360056 RepID=A0A7C4QIE5_9PLAN